MIQQNSVGCSALDRCLSLLSMPPHGTILTICHKDGGFIGGARSEQDCLKVVQIAGDFEQWVLEKKDGFCALRQKVTGLYFGRSDKFGEVVGLAGGWQRNESMIIEETPFGYYAIRNLNGYYVTKTNHMMVWTRELTQQECWGFELAPTLRLNISAVANKINKGNLRELYPMQGGLYAISHCGGGYIGGARENHQELDIVDQMSEETLWIFEKKGNNFALKQRLTGLWLGHNAQPGDHIALAPKWQNYETLTLEKYSDGIYAIKNVHNLYLSKLGNKILWVKTYGPQELWSFETTAASQLDLQDMNGHIFGICNA